MNYPSFTRSGRVRSPFWTRSTTHTAKSDRWLLSYVDLITLLFAFFVLIYAVSTLNEKKYKAMVNSLSQGFHTVTRLLNAPAKNTDQTSVAAKPNTIIQRLGMALSELPAIKENGYRVRYNENWFEIELSSQLLFDPNSLALTPSAEKHLDHILDQIRSSNLNLLVEGYTDNQPVSPNPFYHSNWALSAERAASVVDYFVKHGVSIDTVTVVGYGERFPAVPPEESAAQDKNRRVIIVGMLANTQDAAAERILHPDNSLLLRAS